MDTIAGLEKKLAAAKIAAKNAEGAYETGRILQVEGAEVAFHLGVKSGEVKTLRVKFPDGSAEFLPLKTLHDADARQALSEKYLSLAAIALDKRVVALAEDGPSAPAKTKARAVSKAAGVDPAIVAAVLAALQTVQAK